MVDWLLHGKKKMKQQNMSKRNSSCKKEEKEMWRDGKQGTLSVAYCGTCLSPVAGTVQNFSRENLLGGWKEEKLKMSMGGRESWINWQLGREGNKKRRQCMEAARKRERGNTEDTGGKKSLLQIFAGPPLVVFIFCSCCIINIGSTLKNYKNADHWQALFYVNSPPNYTDLSYRLLLRLMSLST